MNVIGEIGEDRVTAKTPRDVASRITAEAEMRKDLVQEMLLHLLKVRQIHPDQNPGCLIQSCELHGRNHLRRARSIELENPPSFLDVRSDAVRHWLAGPQHRVGKPALLFGCP